MVQVGSFSSEDNANVLRDRLRAEGHSAFVVASQSGGKPLHRVLVGPAASKEAATRMVEPLRDTTRLRGIVMRYTP